MLRSGTIANLINGVSQQPAQMRLPTQCEVQENFNPSVLDGLGKRPGTRYLNRIASLNWTSSFIHGIDRGDGERYVVVIGGGDLKVYNLNTFAEVPVAFPDGKTYLFSASAADVAFRATTVVDFTFILNRDVVSAMATTTSPARPNTAILTVKNWGEYRTYKVYVNGALQCTVETDNLVGDSKEQMNTDWIAGEIRSQLATNLGAGFSVTRKGNTVQITRTSAGNLSVRVEDSEGGNLISVTGEKAQTFSALPSYAPTGYLTEIIGTEGGASVPYWVRHDSKSSDDDAGVWVETVGPGVRTTINAATMPHILVREADGTFTFKRATWAQRQVGTDVTAPVPSFIGKAINDIVFVRNRLGFIAGESVILSRSGDQFNFFPQTVTQQLDDDPIDISATGTKVAKLNYAVPYNEDLLLFADKAQLILRGGELLTPKTAELPQVTVYEASGLCRPLAIGNVVYFATERNRFSGVREWRLLPDGETAEAPEVSGHVQRYLPGDIFSLAGTTSEDTIMVALSRQQRNRIYVYRTYVQGNERLQSAWGVWTFPTGESVLATIFVGSRLILLMQRGPTGGVTLEQIDLESGAADDGSTISYCADRRLYENQMSAPVFDGTHTTFTMPFGTTAALWVFVRAGDAEFPEGTTLEFTKPADNQIRLEGDHRTRKLCIGRKFTARYRFSSLYLRQPTGQGTVRAITAGRTQVTRMRLAYERTGFFEVTVQPKPGGPTYRYTYGGPNVGPFMLDALQLSDGDFSFPVRAKNDEATVEIITDHYLPAFFLSADWDAKYTPLRGQG